MYNFRSIPTLPKPSNHTFGSSQIQQSMDHLWNHLQLIFRCRLIVHSTYFPGVKGNLGQELVLRFFLINFEILFCDMGKYSVDIWVKIIIFSCIFNMCGRCGCGIEAGHWPSAHPLFISTNISGFSVDHCPGFLVRRSEKIIVARP